MSYPATLYTIPPWSTRLFDKQAFSSLALCLALFKLSPFYTNPFVSAKLFHMLLACPIYSTLTICSQQLLNEFFLPGKCAMPKSESHSLAQQLYRATHRPNADIEIQSTLCRCLHSNYTLSYYPKSQRRPENNNSVVSLSNMIYWHDYCPYSLCWRHVKIICIAHLIY